MNFLNFDKITTDFTFSKPAESINLEYKSTSWKLPKTFWETVSSFANTEGGLIVLGITENKKEKTFSITGVDNADDILTQLFNDNNNPTCLNRPIIQNNDVKIDQYKGKDIIQIIINSEPYNSRPITAFGTAYVRTGDGDRKATNDQLKFFAVESQTEIDTYLLPSSYTLDDLDLSSINKYRDQISEKGIVPLQENIDTKEFLYSLGVFRKNRSNNNPEYQLTDGGLLFFGKYISITDRFPRFQLDYQRYNSDTSINWIDRVSAGDMNFPSLNIYSFYNIVLDKLIASVPDKFIQDKNLSRTSYYSDITSAAKEALVNSLMHAYYDGSVGVKIVDRPSYFEFTNPGVMRVSKEAFLRGQYSSIRNTEIATLFRRIGVSETAASGGPRILEAAIRNNLKDPEISIDYNMNTTKIRIWKSTTQPQKSIELNSTQEFILNFAKLQKSFDIQDLVLNSAEKYGKEGILRKNVNLLVDSRYLTKEKEGRKYIYRLNNQNSYLNQVKRIKHLEDDLLN